MRELNNIKIIAVDHGYGNIKTANTVTPTGVTAYETEPIFSGNILEYAGIYYRIGEGHKEFIADKAVDEDYYILTLMAVARELNVYEAGRYKTILLLSSEPMNVRRVKAYETNKQRCGRSVSAKRACRG